MTDLNGTEKKFFVFLDSEWLISKKKIKNFFLTFLKIFDFFDFFEILGPQGTFETPWGDDEPLRTPQISLKFEY